MKWYPTETEIRAIRAAGRITPAADWDCMTVEQRRVARSDFNPHQRWFEQKANRMKA